jgi:hypothetical protein
MRHLTARFLPCLVLVLLAGPVQADILFSQTVIDGGVALASDFAVAQQEADNFALSMPASVQSIHWWGAYTNNAVQTDNFALRLINDVAGNPAPTSFVNVSAMNLTRTTTNLVDNLGDTIYEYQADLPSAAALNGNTTYYLSVVNNSPPGSLGWDWVGSGPGTHWSRPLDTSDWTISTNSTNFAFELLGTAGTAVPEPATLTLLGCGCFGLLAYRWRLRKQKEEN